MATCPECPNCPGQHAIGLVLTVCSPCDSTIALEKAIAEVLSRAGLIGVVKFQGEPAVQLSIRSVQVVHSVELLR